MDSPGGLQCDAVTSAHKEFKKVDKDVVKIAGGDESVVPVLLDRPQIED